MPDPGERKAGERKKFLRQWAEQLIVSVFDHAKRLVEAGRLPSVHAGEIQESEAKETFKTFLRDLHMQTMVLWATSLSLERFSQFFSVLATARDKERVFPQHDGRPRGPLVNCITAFLEETLTAGTPWGLTWGMEVKEEEG